MEDCERPEERKKRVGEAKGSNALAGEVKRWVFSVWRVWVVHCFLTSHSSAGSPEAEFVWGLEGGDGDGEDGKEGSLEVAMEVQSKIPLWIIRPRILGRVLGVIWDSVRPRTVPRVPPRWEP